MKPFHKLFLFHDGISAITEPFTNFSFTRWNFGYHEAFTCTFIFHEGILAIKEPFTRTFFFFTIESWLSRSLSHKLFSFSRCNLGYQGAFLRISLSHDGILAIKEPFHKFLFHTMEFWLSRSLFTNFSFTRWNSQNARFGGRLFSYISQRVFT
jgi:hypothetical protein